jgi:hypothetical protein
VVIFAVVALALVAATVLLAFRELTATVLEAFIVVVGLVEVGATVEASLTTGVVVATAEAVPVLIGVT